jgi:hypothetical protein
MCPRHAVNEEETSMPTPSANHFIQHPMAIYSAIYQDDLH